MLIMSQAVTKEMLDAYLKQLNPKEQIVYEILNFLSQVWPQVYNYKEKLVVNFLRRCQKLTV